VLRSDYAAIQRLMWDGDLRRQFVANPYGDRITDLSPQLAKLLTSREVAGIEESAYYRIASCARALAVVFEHGSVLLNAFGGLRFIEELLKNYLDAPSPTESTHELFDGYILAPEAIRVARSFEFDSNARWLVGLLEFEWAVWHSRRCVMGWAPLLPTLRGFKRTASLLNIRFELMALVEDVVRMRAANVPEAVYRWRCRPNFERPTFMLVFGAGDEIATVELNEGAFDNIDRYVVESVPLDGELCTLLAAHDLI